MITMKFTRFERTVELSLPSHAEAKPATQEYVWAYGLRQSLSDAYASAKDVEEFVGKLQQRADAINNGTVGTRSGGASRTTDPVEKEFKKLVAGKVLEFKNGRKAAGKGIPSDELCQVWLDMWLPKNEEALRAQAVANVEAAKQFAVDGLDIELPEPEAEAEAATEEKPAKQRKAA